MKSERLFSLILVGVSISSCGGGDTNPTTPPDNNPPQFQSSMSAELVENSSASFYTADAIDADGDQVTFSIAGGPDASFFQISGANLSFASNPNFDRYADADSDNIYEIVLRASDGRGGSTDLSLNVTLANDAEGVSVRRLITGLNDPTGITEWLDGGVNRDILLVGERSGAIWRFDGETGERFIWRDLDLAPGRELLDIASRGAGGTTSRPAAVVRDSAGIYLIPDLTNAPTYEIQISSGTPDGADATLSYTNNTELGGQGLLLIATGDPGGQRAQGSSGFGKVYILRNDKSLLTRNDLLEVGKGLQQPSRIFDFLQGVLIADVGQTVEHELSALVSQTPVNFGWPFFEGSIELESGAPGGTVMPSFTYPFGHGILEGTGISGAVYYDSTDAFERSRIASLENRITFSDLSGSIFTVDLHFSPQSFENRTLDFTPDAGSIDSVLSMTEVFDRVLYILDSDGEVFRVDPA